MGGLEQLGMKDLFEGWRLVDLVRAILILALGFALARLLSAGVARLARTRASAQEVMLLRRLTFYTLFGLTVITACGHLGINLGVLFGAAGILTVAIGFASQTSMSNLISGLFMIAERPFVIGDAIAVDGVTGEVLSIDLLSVKLRTFDNLFVRISNESIIKGRLTNLSRFPTRRVDLMLVVSFREDLTRVTQVLLEVSRSVHECLEQPEPQVFFDAFDESGVRLQLSVWATRERCADVKNQLSLEVKAALEREGIEIPFPHRALVAGSTTAPLPVRVIRDSPRSKTSQPGE